MGEVNPCPACGEVPQLERDHDLAWCVNPECGMQGNAFEFDLWNRLTLTPALVQAVVEAAGALVDQYEESCSDPDLAEGGRVWTTLWRNATTAVRAYRETGGGK